MRSVFFLLFFLFIGTGYVNAAPIDTFHFDSKKNEQSFYKLSRELRCLVCQNENIANSNAGLAKDLRLQVYTMLRQGKTEKEILAFMVQRYGDYVLFRPPFEPLTWLLWIGPVVLFGFALIYVINIVRNQSKREEKSLSAEEMERINRLHARPKANTDKESKN